MRESVPSASSMAVVPMTWAAPGPVTSCIELSAACACAAALSGAHAERQRAKSSEDSLAATTEEARALRTHSLPSHMRGLATECRKAGSSETALFARAASAAPAPSPAQRVAFSSCHVCVFCMRRA